MSRHGWKLCAAALWSVIALGAAAGEALAQGALINGDNHTGTLGPGDQHGWTFHANKDDALTISIAEIGAATPYIPQIRLRRPDGVEIDNTWGALAARIHVTAAPISGTYTVVAAGLNGTTGSYRLTLAQSPGVYVVPSGDEGGPLANGANHVGDIHVGDLDQWHFEAVQGDAVTIGIGEVIEGEIDPGFVPQIWLRSPTGQQLQIDWGALAARLHVTSLPISGRYTVVVASQNLSTAGAYTLTLARSPADFVVPTGDQGGTLGNGGNYAGTIHVGDLDQWRFTANKGDAVTVGIGEVFVGETDPGFVPQIWLRGPDGAQIQIDWGAVAARLHATALPLSGVYTVVVASQNLSTAGHYRLTMALTPAQVDVPTDDQGGPITNGANHDGSIHVGDLDQWQFSANKDDALAIGIGEVFVGETDPGFVPLILLRGPDGAQLSIDWGAVAAQLNVTAPLTGTYTVVAASQNLSTAGHYRLTLARTPAEFVVPTNDQGGPMINGVSHAGSIHLGDLDMWTFHASQGATLTVSIGEVHEGEVDPGFVPWIRLRGPTGAQIGTSSGAETAQLTRTAPLSGLYTVIVGSANISTTGHYTLSVTGASACSPAGTLSTATYPPDGGTGTLTITALPGCPWQVTSQAPWLVLTSTPSGSGSGVAAFAVQPNTTGAPRSGTLTVAGQVITITQTGEPVTSTDQDGDGLDDAWEIKFGLNSGSGSGSDGASADPDGDGKTNKEEFEADTHPRGFVITYLAEGATGTFFDTRLALANPAAIRALVLVRFQKSSGEVIREYFEMLPMSRKTIDVATIPGMTAAEFSTLVEADVQIVADRTMTWGTTGYGSHAERGIVAQAATSWFFAEGATHSGFALFYLLQNPTDTPAVAEVTFLRPSPAPPLVKSYAVAPQSRFNVWVNAEAASDPALAPLAATDISAVVRSANGVPIVAERAMYLHTAGVPFNAGHESAGATELSPTWFFAEGATGAFFDLFLLIGNPTDQDAMVQATYLLPDGSTIEKQYLVAARSRFNIWVDLEDSRLADTAVSTTLTSLNGVQVVAERAMWWPGPAYAPHWYEAHNSPGATATGTVWALAEGESGGPRGVETYVLIANTSSTAGEARVTILFEDGTNTAQTFPLLPSSRFNVAMSAMFPTTADRRYGVIVESIGGMPAQIVVERAMYANAAGAVWAAGTNALATRLH